MLPALTRFTAQVALVASLAAPLTSPPAAQQVLSLVAAGVPRSDASLGSAVKSLLAEAPTPEPITNFADAAGTWRVVHAPHIDTLSKLGLTTFNPIEYRISADGEIASFVRYESAIVGNGWLCTDGTIANVAEADRSTVRIVWDRIWWQPGGEADAPPVDPEVEGNAFLAPLVQAIGKAGFIEPLSIFPVRYLDADVGVFNFQTFTITAKRG